MSWNGHRVIDSDSHVYERADRTYQAYVDPEYREPYERLCRAIERQIAAGGSYALFSTREAIIEPFETGRPMGVGDTFGLTPQRGGGSPRAPTAAEPGGPVSRPVPPEEVSWDAQERVEAMDEAEIDVNVIFPTHASSYCALRDVGFESALYRAYHRWVSEFSARAPGRLKWVLLPNLRDVPAAVTEARRWAERDQNLVGIYLTPVGIGGKLLDRPDFHPLYQCAQDVDLPLLVHPGVARPPYAPGMLDMDGRAFLLQSLSSAWAGMAALGCLIGGGVFDLFPTLRVAIFETHSGWLPFAIEQFAENAVRSAYVPNLQTMPAEILASGRYFHGITVGEDSLRYALEQFGEDIWLFTTDFPHRGSPWPYGVRETVAPEWMSESAKRKILGENALRLYTRIR